MNDHIQIINSPRLSMSVRLSPEQAMYVYRLIEKLIQKSFKARHKIGTVEMNFDIVKHCLEILKAHYSESRLTWKTIYLLFQYFEKYQNSEFSPKIADVLYFFLFDTSCGQGIVSDTASTPSGRSMYLPSLLDDDYSFEHHNSIWTLMKIPYRNDYTNIVPQEMNIVWLAAQNAQSHRLLPIFLRQGLMYMPPSSHQNEWLYCSQVLRTIW